MILHLHQRENDNGKRLHDIAWRTAAREERMVVLIQAVDACPDQRIAVFA
jgi:ferredoxin